MTPTEFAVQVGARPDLITRYCRAGKLAASHRPIGRSGHYDWDIPASEVARFASLRKSRSQVATEQWAKRKRALAPKEMIAFFQPAPMDRSEQARAEVMRQAIAGDRSARRTVAQALTYWWNRDAPGQVIVGG